MINLLEKIRKKILEIIILWVILGVVFLLLAILTILYPQIITVLFVVGFGALAAFCFIIAERVYRAKVMFREIIKKHFKICK